MCILISQTHFEFYHFIYKNAGMPVAITIDTTLLEESAVFADFHTSQYCFGACLDPMALS